MRGAIALLVALGAIAFLAGCYPKEPPAPDLQPLPRDAGLETLARDDGLEQHEHGCDPVPGFEHVPRVHEWDCAIRDAVMHEFPAGDPAEILRQMVQESSGRPRAVSSAEAKGLMQLKDGTFRSMCPRGDIWDPETNIRCGVMYRQWCADFWHKGLRSETERNGPLSLGCYHDGPGGMLDAQTECGGYTFAEFGPCASPAARHYVAVIYIPPLEVGR